ncbi:MAG: metallophosphoesterase family protein [Kiritimatiellae bacterium]|nr:metallophosphoesterase family protein [Kiritimatiellia bacterium]
MQYAILGDIHGNIQALSAVLEDAREQGVTHYACVGDVVGYNASPVECLRTIQELNCACVRGNHDHYCSHEESLQDFQPLAADTIDWTRKQLSDEQRKWLAELRLVKYVENFTIVHSTLDMPDKWCYVYHKLDASANFNYQTTSVCFYGHTHVPLYFEKASGIKSDLYDSIQIVLGTKYFINVGSVGQPRDGDSRAAYVVYNLKKREVRLRRVPYDFSITQERILESGLPKRLAARLAVGK